MELTVNSRDYLNRPALGYMVNTLLSKSAQAQIEILQDTFLSEFSDAIWTTPTNSLHITLLDWLAPLVDYTDEKDRVIEKIYVEYDEVLRDILKTVKPVSLTFDHLIISPSAIAVVADEESTLAFNDIRQKFLEKVNLLPNTKRPPTIVHSTIIRFTKEIPLSSVRDVANSLEFSFTERIDCFQLVRETVLPMQEYSVIKKYPLRD